VEVPEVEEAPAIDTIKLREELQGILALLKQDIRHA
jgi:hypothetical protein